MKKLKKLLLTSICLLCLVGGAISPSVHAETILEEASNWATNNSVDSSTSIDEQVSNDFDISLLEEGVEVYSVSSKYSNFTGLDYFSLYDSLPDGFSFVDYILLSTSIDIDSIFYPYYFINCNIVSAGSILSSGSSGLILPYARYGSIIFYGFTNIGYGNYNFFPFSYSLNNDYTISYLITSNGNTCSVNGSSATTTINSGGNGTFNNYYTFDTFSKYYYVCFGSDSSNIFHKYVFVKDSDDNLYFYDLIDKKFYSCSGSYGTSIYKLVLNSSDNVSIDSSINGVYSDGSVVDITCSYSDDYSFIGWYDSDDNLISSDPSFSITMDKSYSLIPKVEEKVINLPWVNYTDRGSVELDCSQKKFEYCLLTANANSGYKFVSWSDGTTDSQKILNFKRTSEAKITDVITANFVSDKEYTTTADIRVEPVSINVTTPKSISYVVKNDGSIISPDIEITNNGKTDIKFEYVKFTGQNEWTLSSKKATVVNSKALHITLNDIEQSDSTFTFNKVLKPGESYTIKSVVEAANFSVGKAKEASYTLRFKFSYAY